jgi:hypothetical protein
MKAAFELKLELAREQEAITKQHAAQKARYVHAGSMNAHWYALITPLPVMNRLLNEALEEERRIYSQTVSKLR